MSVRIVIADDSDAVRHKVRSSIECNPRWEVCGEAADGTAAIVLARELNPDIVVLDFSMPGMNGLEAAREISASSPGTKIVLFTMYGSEQLVKYARWVGVTAVVSKDSRNAIEHLLVTLRTVAVALPSMTGEEQLERNI